MRKLPMHLAGTCAAAVAAALLAVPAPAHAADIKVYSYAVKFVCEEEEGNSVDTSVNFHNPSLTSRAEFLLKIVTTEDESSYHVFRHGSLGQDLAGSVECDFFEEKNGGPSIDITDFEGFLVVLSRKPLDVVGVYEVEHEDEEEGEEVEDIDVVRVEGKIQTVPLTSWNGFVPAT